MFTDPRPKKEKFNSYLKPKIILIGLFAIFFFSINYISATKFPMQNTGFDDALTIMGVLIFAGGIAVSIWAKLTMGKVWGLPAEHNQFRQNKLITHGPFRYSRNPIYLGLILVFMGYGLAIQSYFTFLALVPIYYFWHSVIEEEKLLMHHFKEEYLKYKKEVPRFF